FNETEFRIRIQLGKTCLLQPWIVKVVEVIKTMNDPAVSEKPARQMEADEPGRAGDKYGLAHFQVPMRILRQCPTRILSPRPHDVRKRAPVRSARDPGAGRVRSAR